MKNIFNFTSNEVENIEKSKFQFQNYENFLLLTKYKVIIEKYKNNNIEDSIYGNNFYKELYDIYEMKKDNIKEMII